LFTTVSCYAQFYIGGYFICYKKLFVDIQINKLDVTLDIGFDYGLVAQ